MTEHFEQERFDYAKVLKNTLTEAHIRKIAHNIIELNKSKPETVRRNIDNIRHVIASKKLNTFQVTVDKSKQLAELAAYAARVTSASKVGA